MYRLGRGEGAACLAAEIFDRTQCRARRSTDVIHARLQAIEFFDDGEWNDDVTAGEVVEATGICNQDRRVENDACPCGRNQISVRESRIDFLRVEWCVLSVQRDTVWTLRRVGWWMLETTRNFEKTSIAPQISRLFGIFLKFFWEP